MLLQVSYILVRFPNSLSRVAWLHIYTGFPGSELLCGTGFDGWNGNLWRHLLAIWALLCGANNIYVMYIFQKIFSRQTNILPLSYNGGYQKSWHINGVYQHMSNLLSHSKFVFSDTAETTNSLTCESPEERFVWKETSWNKLPYIVKIIELADVTFPTKLDIGTIYSSVKSALKSI